MTRLTPFEHADLSRCRSVEAVPPALLSMSSTAVNVVNKTSERILADEATDNETHCHAVSDEWLAANSTCTQTDNKLSTA